MQAGTAIARETRAYIASLRGDHAAAARLYAEAIELPDSAPEQHGRLILNQAAALSDAGDHSGAVSLLDRSQGQLRDGEIARSRVLEVHALARRGDHDEARRRALSFAEADHTEPSDLLCAAALLEDLEDWEAAETVYRRTEDDPATMNYCLARLKIRVGQIDSAFRLLKRATESSRSTVARLLQRDRALWGDCADDERFRSLTEPEGETAVPGR